MTLRASAKSRNQPLPVYLLTGFLGSGKTTLLSRLIHKVEFSDTAVIINEFGEVGLDHVLVGQSTDEDIVLLDSGCLCCVMNSSLQDSLESLYYRRLRAEIPAFSRVVIETSGLAEPSTIINTLSGDASVTRHYYLAGVITAVDGLHGLRAVESFREAATQVAVADKLILTKTDLIDPTAQEAIIAQLRTHNALAPITWATATNSGQEQHFFDQLAPTGSRAATAISHSTQPTHRMTPLSHVLKYGIASYLFRLPEPVRWSHYARWVSYLQKNCGDKLLRVKGVLTLEDGQSYAIHGVHHVFSPPDQLTGTVPAEQKGIVIIIAQDLSREELVAAFELFET